MIRDAVTDKLGWDPIMKAFIDCHYQTRTSWEDVTDRALEVSGYNRVRAELFPESS